MNKILHLFIITVNVMFALVSLILIMITLGGLYKMSNMSYIIFDISPVFIYLFSISLFISSVYCIAEAVDNLIEQQ